MSEFTAGVLFLAPGREKMAKVITELEMESFIQPLNDKWNVLINDDDFLIEPTTVQKMLEISRAIPLLYFFNAEDHEWGYRIFNGGAEVAAAIFEHSEETAFNLAVNLGAQRYPDMDVIEDLLGNPEASEIWDALMQEVYNSAEYKEIKGRMVEKLNPAEFKVFGLSDEEIMALSELMLMEGEDKPESSWEQVEQVKTLLGAEEFSWMSSYHLGNEDGFGDFDEDSE